MKLGWHCSINKYHPIVYRKLIVRKNVKSFPSHTAHMAALISVLALNQTTVCLFTSQHSLVHIAPTHGGMARLSWSAWLVTYGDGLPACRRSPTQVLTGPGVDWLRWCDQRRHQLSQTATTCPYMRDISEILASNRGLRGRAIEQCQSNSATMSWPSWLPQPTPRLMLTVFLFFVQQLIAQSANIVTKLSQLSAEFDQTTLCRLQLSRQLFVVACQLSCFLFQLLGPELTTSSR